MSRFRRDATGIRWTVVFALALLSGWILTGQALAEKRLGLVIGNSDYQHAGVLSNPKNDALLISDALKSVGFETEIRLDLNENDMGAAIDSLAAKAREADVLVVYYAGHAIQVAGENYLIPTDANLTTEASVQRQAISLASLMDAMAQVPVSILLLDACRDNPFTQVISRNESATGRSVRINRGIAVVRPVGDMLIAFATLPNAVALDGRGSNSPFAEALASHIPTENTEVSVVMKRVTKDVLEKTEGRQRPQQLSQMQQEFYFRATSTGERFTKQIDSILSVYPVQVQVGEEVALVADVPPSCKAVFFNLTQSGKVTPIPATFFTRTALSSGHLRHEISPGTRYGLVVQEQDEKGNHALGFFCEPDGLDKPGKIKLLKILNQKIVDAELDGSIGFEGSTVHYNFRQYVIR